MQHTKTRKTYTLRKTTSRVVANPQQTQQNKSDLYEKQSQGQMQGSQNLGGAPSQMSESGASYAQQQQSQLKQSIPLRNSIIQEPQYQPLVDGQELLIDNLSLKFDTQLNNVQVKDIKVKNIGESAIYFDWQCKNIAKINQSAIKDPKSRFYCHYLNNVIKPGEQITFAFSFLSDIPGIFIEQFDLITKPQLKTPIPSIKLQGKAFIQDQHKADRQRFITSLKETSLSTDVNQILDDFINAVKPPQPPLPDVTNPQIAQKEFQSKNASFGLFYNPIVHGWFRQLFVEVYNKVNGIQSNKQEQVQEGDNDGNQQKKPQPYWDQSIQTLKSMITNSTQQQIDEVQKTCYLDRLYHYYHISTFPPSNKSKLFPAVRQYLYLSSYKLGGDYADSVKKQLEMWEVPFRQPQQEENQADLKAYQEEVTKIKAEWVKKAKKKKWGQEEQKAMVQDFKKKLGEKVQADILSAFDGFEDKAQFIKVQSLLNSQQNNVDIQKYSDFLERLKTVKETPLQGQKVMIKFNLKLKENSEQKVKQLHQYIQLKKQEEKRLEEQKKNQQQNAKKKKAPPKKKKGKQQEQVVKPLVFDFMSLLDQENWNGFIETYKIVQQKSPILTLIACSYGGKQGRFVNEFSVKFILEHLRATVDPAIQFLEHEGLAEIKQKLENETLNEGSVYLLENINFMPAQVLQKEEQIKPENNQQQAQQKPSTYQLRKLLYPQICDSLKNQLAPILDIIISEQRFSSDPSGIMSYLFKQNIVGTLWWKYISFCLRLFKNKRNNAVMMGGDFNPQKLLVLGRLLLCNQNVRKIQLVGQIGAKFALAKRWGEQNADIPADGKKWYGFTVSKSQVEVILRFLKMLQNKGVNEKLCLPRDFILRNLPEPPKQEQAQNLEQAKFLETKIFSFKPIPTEQQPKPQQPLQQNYQLCDIGPDTLTHISDTIEPSHLFIFGKPTLKPLEYYKNQQLKNSMIVLVQLLYKKQEQKRNRHKLEQNTPAGINFDNDLVVLTIGIDEKEIETINFKDPKIKKKKQNQEDGAQQEQQEQEEPQQEQQEQQGKKKIDQIVDFRLNSQKCVYRVLSGKFMVGLRDIERYPKSED